MPVTPGERRDCQHVTVKHRHGTVNAYINDRCKCALCRKANAQHAARRRKLQHLGRLTPTTTTAVAARRYIDGLRLAGWTLPALCREMSCCRRTLDNVYLLDGITVVKAARIKQLHDRLINVTPINNARNSAKRSVTIARKRGALPVLAYDNIADPTETPTPYEPPPRTYRSSAVLLAEVDHFRGFGDTDDQIARRLGMEPDSLRRALDRAAA